MPSIDPDLPEPRLDDAPIPPAALGLHVPLTARWPEPRLLHQTEMWFEPDGHPLWLRFADPSRLAVVLLTILRLAPVLHRRAADDERLATSSAMRRSLAHLGVPGIDELDPAVWIESTELVRWLRGNS